MEEIVKSNTSDKQPKFYKENNSSAKLEMKRNPNDAGRMQRGKYRTRSTRQVLWKVIDDASFLEKLSKHPELSKTKLGSAGGEEVEDFSGRLMKAHALEAVVFFEKKMEFWTECSTMRPSQKQR